MHRFRRIPDWTPGYINACPHHVDIMVECTACGEMREFDRRSLPPNLTHALITDIEKRLKCTSCGEKAGKLIFGSYMNGE